MNDRHRPWIASYDPHVAPEIVLPQRTAGELLDETVARFGGRMALRFHGARLTFAELSARADRVAQALAAQGIGAGDVVAINLPNVPDYLIAQLGALRAGCAASGLSPLLSPDEIVFQLRDCRARALFTLDAIFEHRLLGVARDLPELRLVVASGLLDALPLPKRLLGRWLKRVPRGKLSPLPGKRVLSFVELLRSFPATKLVVPRTLDDVVLVQYTGGTTGKPKGAQLTQRSLLANLEQFSSWLALRPGEERFLSAFPFFHLAGLAVGLGGLLLGAPQELIPDPRDVRHVTGALRRHRPTIVANVPSMYGMLVDEPSFARAGFAQLKCCISGAAPLPGPLLERLERIVGAGKVLEVYGMTEASPLVAMNPLHGPKRPGSVGLPLPSTRVRLMDLESGCRDVPRGEEGEIVVNGPQVMRGYLGKPEETAQALREHDGETWLHTGDVARFDAEGCLTLVDRCKDMINVSGYKVFSAEVEEKLLAHPAIAACAVVGVPNPERAGSERIRLVVQPTAAAAGAEEALRAEILAFCKEHLAPYKVPKIVDFVAALPLTPLGKVDKRALR